MMCWPEQHKWACFKIHVIGFFSTLEVMCGRLWQHSAPFKLGEAPVPVLATLAKAAAPPQRDVRHLLCGPSTFDLHVNHLFAATCVSTGVATWHGTCTCRCRVGLAAQWSWAAAVLHYQE
jgi:hypothetical protein